MLHLVSLVLEFLLIPSRVSFLLSNTFLVLSFAGNRVSECGQSSRSRDIKNEVTTVEIIKDSVYLFGGNLHLLFVQDVLVDSSYFQCD